MDRCIYSRPELRGMDGWIDGWINGWMDGMIDG